MLQHLNLTTFEAFSLWGVLVVAVLGLIYALFLRRQVLAADKGHRQDAGSVGSDQAGRRCLS
ncbi:hypothetical protein [Candidatus Amarolinea dominans]|uniref:hypothetical protein n=1 Tax=Candidatus Amarolinea dominans TaxID=3140696 RepID=UPI0031CC8EEF